jgi:hypothetical protein
MVGTLDIPRNLFNKDLKIKVGFHFTYDIETKSYLALHPNNIPYYLNMGKVI